MSKTKPAKTIKHISDTARWVAVYRAAESGRPDALFNDRFAGLLAGPHGADIVKSIPGGAMMGWAVVLAPGAVSTSVGGTVSRVSRSVCPVCWAEGASPRKPTDTA